MFHVYLCHAVLSVPCSLVVPCWERADLLAVMCDFLLVFVTFPYGVPGQVWYLIVSIPDLCLPLYLARIRTHDLYFCSCVRKPHNYSGKYNVSESSADDIAIAQKKFFP